MLLRNGRYGGLRVDDKFDAALLQAIHYDARFMARNAEAPGWTWQFREIVRSIIGLESASNFSAIQDRGLNFASWTCLWIGVQKGPRSGVIGV